MHKEVREFNKILTTCTELTSLYPTPKPIHVHWELVNVNLFGNLVFADVNKLR